MPKATMKQHRTTTKELTQSHLMIQGFNQRGQRDIGMIFLELVTSELSSNILYHEVLLAIILSTRNAKLKGKVKQCKDETQKSIKSSRDQTKQEFFPGKRTDEGFNPKAYKLSAKAMYDFTSSSQLKELSPETIEVNSNPESSEDEPAKAPQAFEDEEQATVDELKELNLGTNEDLRPIYVSVLLSHSEEKSYLKLLLDYKDVFAWSYKEMSVLIPRSNNVCPKDDFPLPINELMVDVTTGHEALSFADASSGCNVSTCHAKIFDDMLHKNVECYVDDLVTIKGQALVEFLADHPILATWEISDDLPNEEIFYVDVLPSWMMFFDGERCSNNVAKYQALIIGLQMAIKMKVTSLEICGILSWWVLPPLPILQQEEINATLVFTIDNEDW
ncbi:hypothetical protein CK203_098457 [Vitis vinifera]|uniref:Reverse transcriptase/retrotransposon-derived protein RNase H-like domain-containing protein n=1 Tax=Vitis vinifera TaxID=29760 RepID=A0A438FIQ3_VITVI|nr:hypothetical protein CK203_098457 [Vitis vinifera]